MKILNLYAGIGGNRQKWGNSVEVTAVEYNKDIATIYQDLYPNDTVVITDAHAYLLENYKKFDFIWASPPCQSHSKMVKATRHKKAGYFDLALYQEIIFLQNFFKGNWIIENVNPYYKPLIKESIKIGRHLFWSNLNLHGIKDIPRPKNFINKSTAEGKKELMKWLNIYYKKNIYYEGNHCVCQILRNCVHPLLGLQLFERALNKEIPIQGSLFGKTE